MCRISNSVIGTTNGEDRKWASGPLKVSASSLLHSICDSLSAGQTLPALWLVYRIRVGLKPLVYCLQTLARHATQKRHATLRALGAISRIQHFVALALHVRIRIVRRTYKQDYYGHPAKWIHHTTSSKIASYFDFCTTSESRNTKYNYT